MSEPELITIREEDRVVTITLNNPPLNVMTMKMMSEICDALAEVEGKGHAGLIIFRGQGKLFSAGADVKEHLPEQVGDMIRGLHNLVEAMIGTRTPILAVLHKTALGGAFEFASLADVVLVREGTRLGLPEIHLASFPPVAAAFFPSMIGWKNTLHLLLTGETMTAEKAVDLGLATAVLPEQGFEESVKAWINKLTHLSLPALKLCKMAAMGGFIQRPFDALTTAESLFVQELMKTHDAKEGLEAFIEKRKPAWEHR